MTPDPQPPESTDKLDRNPRARVWFGLALLLCLLTTIATMWIGRNRDRIRSSDEAAYAEQAGSLLRDGSLTVGFVRHFHVQYPPGVDHPEDFYPPGTGALIALSWAVQGRSDFASAVPAMILTGLLLPLLAWALARQLGASPPFAMGCAATVLLAPALRFHTFQGLADVPLTTCVTGAVVLALRSGRTAAALAGLVLGLGLWFKPAAVLFLPGVALAVLIAGARNRREATWRLMLFVLLFAIACAPWLIRNQMLFDDPLYSGNKHLAAAATQPGHTYYDLRKIYWDEAAPDLVQRVTDGTTAWLIRWATKVYQLFVDVGWSVFGLPFAIGTLLLWRRRPVVAVLTVIATFAVALAAVFAVFERYFLPILPLVVAIAWAGGDYVARHLRSTGISPLLAPPSRAAVLLTALATLPGGMHLVRDLGLGKRDYGGLGAARPLWNSATWARDHLPEDAHVMSQEALRFRHASGLRAINTPWDEPDAIERVVQHYGVTHLMVAPSGDFAAISNRFVLPYLETYADRWKRRDQGDFTVWTRR